MIAAPMSTARHAAARPPFGPSTLAASVLAVVLAACGTTSSATPRPSIGPSTSAAPTTPAPTASPVPTIAPTPSYTNPPDPALARLIPRKLLGVKIEIPDPDQFGITPGDIGQVYGDIGLRFRALQIAFVPRPQSLSLYAMAMDEPFATTADLEPHLGTAGQYVGISQPERKPWKLKRIDGRVVWVRPEDNATAAGTMVYTWATDGYVFLLIGIDDALNRAMFKALPGEDAPSPTPKPSQTPASSGSEEESASPSPS